MSDNVYLCDVCVCVCVCVCVWGGGIEWQLVAVMKEESRWRERKE